MIQEILHQRCSWNASFGRPRKVATIDRFQGEQSDYVILSLVRTKNVGHLRDLRRLTVAMSRACLGLYVVGRFSLFGGVQELKPVFDQFGSRNPSELYLLPEESYGSIERPCERTLDLNGKVAKEKMLTVKNIEEFGKYLYGRMQKE